MIRPPRLALWILEHTLATSERDAVAGDLCEEFSSQVVPTRGVARARWWYWSQVGRSLAPLVFRSWERASVGRSAAAMIVGALAGTVPPLALVVIRTFVLQQVPLKTTTEPSLTFAMSLAVVLLVSGALGLTTVIRLLDADSRQR